MELENEVDKEKAGPSEPVEPVEPEETGVSGPEAAEKAPDRAPEAAGEDTAGSEESVKPEGEEPEAAGEPAENENMKWYVLHAYSGYEKKVKELLTERLRQSGLSGRVGQILVPEEDVVEVKGGRRRISTRKFYPGYVMIQMEMDEKLWYVVKETPKITGFLGDASTPVPLTQQEVSRIREQMSGVATAPRPKHIYDVGETVRVIDGPFANFTGVLEEVNPERGKVKVMVTIFGRSTPVELEFSQIEKV